MFGYIRPYKPELKLREFSRYRSIYCGLCKTISRNYGQLPRFATTYDMTFLALFLLALEGEEYGQALDSCMFHPGQKLPVANPSHVLEFTAAAAVLLAYYKFEDNIQDKDKVVLSQTMRAAYRKAKAKATEKYPDLEAAIQENLVKQKQLEKMSPDQVTIERATEPFAMLMEAIMALAPVKPEVEANTRQAMILLAGFMGRWIYTMDAVEDREDDKAKGQWNPLAQANHETLELIQEKLLYYEEQIDLIGQLLPFYRDAIILGNIIQMGLPSTREDIFAGKKLMRV